MSRIVLALLLATAWLDAHAQSSRPRCSRSISPWTTCFGTVTLKGNKYVGEFRGNKFHGQGTYEWSDGDKYVGEWEDGRRSGQGTYTQPIRRFKESVEYVGEWKDGKYNGQGTLTFSNGEKYVGEWRDDKRHGQGIRTFLNVVQYTGEWRDNKYHGRGTLKFFDYCDKGRYESLPMRETLPADRSNLKCQVSGGFEKLLFETYVGLFEDGARNGFGTYYSSKGEIIQQGVWSQDSFIDAKTEAQFRYEQDVILMKKVRTEKRELLTRTLIEIDASLLQIARETQERRRIEIAGDGSEDDQTCKSRKLKPVTAPYKKCRSDLVAIREAAERRDRQRVVAAEKDPFFFAKEQCKELGFKDKTEKFGGCVLELSKRSGIQTEPSEPNVMRSDGSPDDETCAGYGYTIGTTGYADCRLKLDQARQQYERELAAYNADRAEYDRRAAAIKKDSEFRDAMALSQYGLCLASCGNDLFTCATRCGSGSTGAGQSAGVAPVPPSGFSTYILNGKVINCSQTGSIVTCN